jgi:hypothetical protein
MLKPLTIANDLADSVVSLLETGKQFSPEDKQLLSLEFEAKKLAKADPAEGYILLAGCSMLRADFNEMDQRYQIAINQGLSAANRLNYSVFVRHAGFYSQAAQLVEQAAEAYSDPIISAHKGMMCLNFDVASRMLQKGLKMQLISESSQEYTTMIGVINSVLSTKLDQNVAIKIADLAGEVLRGKSVFHKTEAEIGAFPSDDEVGAFIVATFNVPTSFETASDMTSELADRIFASGIELPNFGIRFRGEREE